MPHGRDKTALICHAASCRPCWLPVKACVPTLSGEWLTPSAIVVLSASIESPERGTPVSADANHIIHACTHPAWRDEAFTSEGEMFQEMHAYLERLCKVCRWAGQCCCTTVLWRLRKL